VELPFDELSEVDMKSIVDKLIQQRATARNAYETSYKRTRTLSEAFTLANAAFQKQNKTTALCAAVRARIGHELTGVRIIKSKRTQNVALHLFLPEPSIVCTGNTHKLDLVKARQRRPMIVVTLPFVNHKNVEIYDAEVWEEEHKYVSYPHQTIEEGTPCWGDRGGKSLGAQITNATRELRIPQVLALIIEYLNQGCRNHKSRGQSVSLINAKEKERYDHKRKEKKRGTKAREKKPAKVAVRRPREVAAREAHIPTLDDVISQINVISTTYASHFTQAEKSAGVQGDSEQVGDSGAESTPAVPASGLGADAPHSPQVGEGGGERVREAGDGAGEARSEPGVRGPELVDDTAT
jgi:hypothetical protein